MRLISFALLVLLGLAVPVLAQTMDIVDEPAWVEVLPVPPDDPKLRAEVEDGQYFLLSDHQLRWDGEIKQSYGRSVAEVTDRAGLEEMATVTVDFDPEFETVSLARLVIRRGEEEIDLKGKVQVQVYRRETRLEEGIIDGTLTAVVQVPDLRVGDVLDQATILTRRPMLAADERSGSSWLEWSTPVVLSRTLVTWPEGMPLEVGPLPPRVDYSATSVAGGMKRHEWRREGHIPPVEEEGVPYEVIEDALLRFADGRDWTPIALAMAPHYTKDYPLPSAWEARVAEIAKAHSTPEARAYAALRLVQEELRYVSLSVGAGGYFARTPEEVIAAGFGDCKDKSLLLRVILARLGIEAFVALTDLDAGYGLPEELPMLGVFDHMILRATLDGQAVWMDPTGSHQGGGLGTATLLDYGYALALTGKGPAALERMEVTAEGVWAQDIREEFSFTLFGMFLQVETLHRAGSADATRARWATNPVSQISREFLDYYEYRYPGLRAVGPPTMVDDRAANRITITEHYFLPPDALDKNGLREEFVFATEGLVDSYPDRVRAPRRLPLEVAGPWVTRHVVEVVGGPIDFAPPEDLTISNAAFDFSLKGEASEGGNMVLRWSFQPKVRSVPAGEAEAVLDDIRAVRDATWYSWDLTED
jgi:transglutaminase-like putative cysteine protease